MIHRLLALVVVLVGRRRRLLLQLIASQGRVFLALGTAVVVVRRHVVWVCVVDLLKHVRIWAWWLLKEVLLLGFLLREDCEVAGWTWPFSLRSARREMFNLSFAILEDEDLVVQLPRVLVAGAAIQERGAIHSALGTIILLP